jgi:AraC-like DNA-binding protein
MAVFLYLFTWSGNGRQVVQPDGSLQVYGIRGRVTKEYTPEELERFTLRISEPYSGRSGSQAHHELDFMVRYTDGQYYQFQMTDRTGDDLRYLQELVRLKESLGPDIVRIEDREYPLTARQEILILPNLIHEYVSEEKTSLTRLIIFSGDFLPELRKDGKNGIFRTPVLKEDPKEFNQLAEMQEDHFLFRAHLYRIAARYQKNPKIPMFPRRNSDFILGFSDYLETHCTEKIDEKSVATVMGYHPRYLSQLINRNFGVSFKVLLNEYRIRIAEELLSDSTKSITEISEEVGFATARTFNRAFSKQYKLSPTEYRVASRRQSE